MELIHTPHRVVQRLGVFPGGFNPPTVAHLALAGAALSQVDEVLFVLPRVFPHDKNFRDTTLEQRLELLRLTVGNEPRFAVGIAERGLFVEIAHEARELYGADVRLSFLCGRDAAERIAGWDYGRTGAWREMLREFDLLVAPRAGEYRPEEWDGIRRLALASDCDAVSSSEVRRRVAAGENWEELVPEKIRQKVREWYG